MAWNNRGYAKAAKGDSNGAMADYNHALSLDPKLATAYYNRSKIEKARGESDVAATDQIQAILYDPNLAEPEKPATTPKP